RDGVSGNDGSMTFTNVPVGVYELTVNDVPANYVLPDGVQETFVVEEGEDVVLVNQLAWNSGFLKTVCVADQGLIEWIMEIIAGVDPDDEEELIELLLSIDCSDIALEGVNVVVYEEIGEDSDGGPVVGPEPVFQGVTGPDGTVGAPLPP